jgi:hypothetical protein
MDVKRIRRRRTLSYPRALIRSGAGSFYISRWLLS